MKPVIITLLFITFWGDNCSSWYHSNVKIKKNRKYKPFTNQNIYIHKYEGKRVIGYICGGNEPQ